ncbi:MAG: twin transmembrane helix small protein [Proteobacteria bacterium]|nr:twin transmembrane helix small protein [Pseudomonadota bacterium]
MNDVLTVLVAVALIATLAVLLAGVVTMAKGGAFNRKWGNKLMRARVATQGLAILLLLALFLINRGWGG